MMLANLPQTTPWQVTGWVISGMYLLLSGVLLLHRATLKQKGTMPPRPRYLQLILGLFSGLFSFALTFLCIPGSGMVDFIWIALRLLLPGILIPVVLHSIGGFSRKYLISGMVVQYILLILFAPSLCRLLLGGELSAGYFGSRWLEYLGACFAFPAAVTSVQYLLLLLLHKHGKAPSAE